MVRLNTILLILGTVLVLNALLLMNRDNSRNNRDFLLREAGLLPTKEEAHVHLKSRKKKKIKQNGQSEDPFTMPEFFAKREQHQVAGLNCDAYGGPSEEDAAEMVYWEDIPSDSSYISPLKKSGETQYLTFEPDEGGWNNIRMSMETAVTLAHAMGRTLVLPPAQGMYLLHKSEKGQKNRFTFSDFFHFDSVATEHAGVDVITMKEFMKREVMTGNLKDKTTGLPAFPPGNRTNWDGAERHEAKKLDKWFRTCTKNPIWAFDSCVVGLPSGPGSEGPKRLNDIQQRLQIQSLNQRIKRYKNNPVLVDAPAEERLSEMYAHRNRMCVYDEEHQNAKVIHMMGDNASGARLLVHFYAFLFFEDWKQDLWTKRFVRDHLRYVDEIQCAAARVVTAMRQKAREHGNEEGIFDTFHIRRGDFQYKDTRIEANQIYANIKDLVADGTTVYIATDERDRSFFNIFREHYNVYFLDDFKHLLEDVNTNFFGMLDQRIASRGRKFIGTYYSTFTGYINRMRGYHSQKEKSVGWEKGIMNSWYYVPVVKRDDLVNYYPIHTPMWAREFPVAWRDLDNGIGQLG